MTDISLAFSRIEHAPPIGENRRLRSALSWVLVALVHVLFLMVLLVAERPHETIGRKPLVETLLTLTALPRGVEPPIRIIRPDVPNARPPLITTAPVVVVPLPDFITPETAGDILKAIGEALSCGASNFENLTQAERARCPRAPWLARRLPNGTLVLDAPSKALMAEQPRIVTGAEQLRHQMQTAPPCPILVNTPCVQAAPNIFDSNRGILPDQRDN